MDASWQVEQRLEIPTPKEFSSQLEARNIPVVFKSAAQQWPAYTKWQPANGGFEYLKSLATDAPVQAMLSTSGGTFYGDIRGHERVGLTFGEYIDYVLQLYTGDANDHAKDVQANQRDEFSDKSQLYLAQVSILNKEQQEPSPLKVLMQDVILPHCLNPDTIKNVNLWMSALESKSSTHYDPYQNLLCVVAGRKQVSLWPPSATPFLYPKPIHGESSNHSSVDFMKPDLATHPLFEHAPLYCRIVTLEAGDILFIPEGWYHQVDTSKFTIAINLWWPSMISLALGSHMDGYYLRRIVSSLLDTEKEKISGMVKSISINTEEEPSGNIPAIKQSEPTVEGVGEMHQITNTRQLTVELLTPLQKYCLQSLVMAGSPEDNVDNSKQYNEVGIPVSAQKDATDVVSQIFGILDPLSLKQLLGVMVDHFPRTLEMLIIHKLSPLAAELLTKKFDEMDEVLSEDEQAKFYKSFYDVFEDSRMAMSALLDRKEAFSEVALESVFERYLGLKLLHRSN